MIYIKNKKAIVCSFLSFFIFTKSIGQTSIKELSFVDCKSQVKLADVVLFDDSNHLIGTTDDSGKCKVDIIKYNKVAVSKFGYRDTVFALKNSNSFCLQEKQNSLSEVNVISEKIDPTEYLIKLRNQNIKNFIHEDSEVYYSFKYRLTNSSDTLIESDGVIMIHYHDYAEFNMDIYYVQINYHQSPLLSKKVKKPDNIYTSPIEDYYLDGIKNDSHIWQNLKDSHNTDMSSSIDSGLVFRYWSGNGNHKILYGKYYFDNSKNIDSILIYHSFKMLLHKLNISNGKQDYCLEYVYSNTYPRVLSTMKSNKVLIVDGELYDLNFEMNILNEKPAIKLFEKAIRTPTPSVWEHLKKQQIN